MKKIAGVLSLFTLIFLAACSSPLQDELMAYANEELPRLGKMEASAMKKYEEAANTNDEQKMAEVIKNSVIPAYTKISEQAEEIDITDEELQKLHKRYTDAVNQQIEGYTMAADAIDQQNKEMFDNASSLINENYSKMESFRKDLEAYAVDNDLKVEEPKD
ncbi:hypothetical protein CEF21_00985 [Bacillus sp. FJAT-42376]|uniref:hypothetical protein n=1 Tax=Bacillus sp. FJAT-42376 TaxID=2014076 RepID=UPI000F4D6C6F|nr:hypothetical protein [Bacillus sp. FJAT-42376]AZB41025.1 hypothetical protein CEF21_00985 [Bacillus sp. FJAT-42376]